MLIYYQGGISILPKACSYTDCAEIVHRFIMNRHITNLNQEEPPLKTYVKKVNYKVNANYVSFGMND